jgi:hypothetical protein
MVDFHSQLYPHHPRRDREAIHRVRVLEQGERIRRGVERVPLLLRGNRSKHGPLRANVPAIAREPVFQYVGEWIGVGCDDFGYGSCGASGSRIDKF